MPEVSIIVPSYNHSEFLKERLESIINQSFCDFELILLDDCSTDNSTEILSAYQSDKRVSQLLINKKNSGSSFRQWQKGIALAKAEYIWVAESDDKCETDFLMKLIPYLKRNERIGLIYCQSWNINKSGERIDTWLSHTDDLDNELFRASFIYNGKEFVKKFMLQKNVIPNASAVVFRKSLYKAVGGIESNLKYCADWLLWMKLCMVSDVAFIPEKLNSFRRHNNSVINKAINKKSSNRFYLLDSDLKMRQKFNFWLKKRRDYYDSFLKMNQEYLDKAFKEKAIHYIWQGSFIKSFIYSLGYSRIINDKKVLLVPFKRLPFIILKPLTKLIKGIKK